MEKLEYSLHRRGFEPLTARFVAGYSIQLSYRCKRMYIVPPSLLDFKVKIKIAKEYVCVKECRKGRRAMDLTLVATLIGITITFISINYGLLRYFKADIQDNINAQFHRLESKMEQVESLKTLSKMSE